MCRISNSSINNRNPYKTSRPVASFFRETLNKFYFRLFFQKHFHTKLKLKLFNHICEIAENFSNTLSQTTNRVVGRKQKANEEHRQGMFRQNLRLIRNGLTYGGSAGMKSAKRLNFRHTLFLSASCRASVAETGHAYMI